MRSLKEISDTLKNIRKKHGYTQAKLRILNGMTQQQISRLENAKDITLSNLIRTLEVYNLEIEFIVQERFRYEHVIEEETDDNEFAKIWGKDIADMSDDD